MQKELKKYLHKIESNLQPLNEFMIGGEISKIIKAKNYKITKKEEIAELIAFKFFAGYSDKGTSWGSYYGPMFILPNEEGYYVEFPSIKIIDQEIIDYWRQRAKDSKHPSLTCRYADLVIDFETAFNKAFDYKMAQIVIDATIEICSKNLDSGLGCKTKLNRAFSLAKQINDSSRIYNLLQIIIDTEQKFAEDNKPGLWGYAFKWLLLNKTENLHLNIDQQRELTNELEQRLDRLSKAEDPNPWCIEHAVELLTDYYAKNAEEAKLQTTLEKLEQAFRKNKHANSDGLLIVNYLEKLSEIYLRYSQFEFAKQAVLRITTELSNLGDRGKFKTYEIATELKIKSEEIKVFIDSIFGEKREEALEKVIIKISINFIPKKDQIEKQLKDISKKYLFRYLGNQLIMSEDGFPISEFGSIDEDYNRHLLQHFSENLHFQTPFLRWTFDVMREQYSPEDLYNVFKPSKVFRLEDKDYILKTLELFWNSNYLPSSCLMVPLIEDAVRNIYRANKISYIKRSEDSTGYNVISLHKLLEFGLIKKAFRDLGEHVEYYFKVMLTERIGWNLRNNFAHGLNKNAFASEDIANRLLHVILCLSLVRNNEKGKQENGPI